MTTSFAHPCAVLIVALSIAAASKLHAQHASSTRLIPAIRCRQQSVFPHARGTPMIARLSPYVFILLTAGCAAHPRPFLYSTDERDFIRALRAVKDTLRREPGLLPTADTGALLAVVSRATRPSVTLLATGATPREAVSSLMGSAPLAPGCGRDSGRVVLFAPSRSSGLPLSIVDCRQVEQEVAQFRAAQALTIKMATDLARLGIELDSLTVRLSRDETLLAQSVTIDIVQQDLLNSRGSALDSLQVRLTETAQRLRRLSQSTRMMSDSLSRHLSGIDERLGRLKVAIDAIR